MTLLKDITDCSTYSVRGLDNQLIAELNRLQPGLLAKIDDIPNIELGQAVHPWLQKAARPGLVAAIAARGQTLHINSAYRTLAGQQLLRFHYENSSCGITAAAYPGKSNHNGASAIDVEDSEGWRQYLEKNDWRWLGDFDAMHYDSRAEGIEDIFELSVKAFQGVWSQANPMDKLALDGDFGNATSSRLAIAPAEGFGGLEPPRILRFTNPIQIGKDVGVLQLAIRKFGIAIAADQVFGNGTDVAVKQFQSSVFLLPDGIVGDKTRKALGV